MTKYPMSKEDREGYGTILAGAVRHRRPDTNNDFEVQRVDIREENGAELNALRAINA